MEPRIIAKRRVIKRIELGNRKGVLVANGTLFRLDYHDLLDLCNAVEMVMLKLTHKLLRQEFRPRITNRDALKDAKISAGAYDLYAGDEGAAPCPPEQECSVTEDVLTTHYLRVELAGEVWHNWFCRLDELVKCLYVVIREAQKLDDAVLPGVRMTADSVRAPVKRINLSPEVLH